MSFQTGLIVCDSETMRKDAYDLYSLLNEFKCTAYQNHQTSCRTNEEFYNGKQWDKEELTANRTAGNYTVTINMIQRAIDFITGQLTARKPSMIAKPTSKEYTYQCNLAQKIYDWHFEKCGGQRLVRDWVKNAIMQNISYLFVYADENGNPVTEELSYEDVIVDPASKKPMFEDARRIFIRRTMLKEEAIAKYGITTTIGSSPSVMQSIGQGAYNQIKGTDSIDEQNTYYSVVEQGRVFSSDGKYVELYESYCVRKVPVGDQILERVVCETLIGFEHVYVEVLPESITSIPLIPLYVRKGRNPYGTGIVESMREPQKFANKIHGVMLKNAMTVGFPKTLIPKNLVPNNNFEKFKKSFNSGTIMEYNPIGSDAAKGIVTIQGQPISDSIIQMYQSAIGLMEYNSAPKESMGYQNSSDPASANAMGQQKEMILDSLKTVSGNIEDGINQHAKVVLQFSRAYMKDDTVIEVSAGIEIQERIRLNQKMQLNPNDEQSVKQFIEAQVQSGKHQTEAEEMVSKAKDDLAYMDTIAQFILNDIRNLNVIMAVKSDSMSIGSETTEYRLLLSLMEKGVTVPPEVLMEHAPLENKEAMIKKISEVGRLRAENMQMQQALEQMQNELKKAQDEQLKLQQQMILVEHETDLYKVGIDARYKEKTDRAGQTLSNRQLQHNYTSKMDKLMFALEQLLDEAKKEDKGEKPSDDMKTKLLQFATGEGR